MPLKPRKVNDSDFFLNDWREEGRFWWLERGIQPVVGIRPDTGQFHAHGIPLEVEEIVFAGNAGVDFPAGFVDGQIWRIEMMTILAAAGAGATYTGLYDGQPIGGSQVVAAAQAGDLLGSSFTLDGQILLTVLAGAAADTVIARAVRVV